MPKDRACVERNFMPSLYTWLDIQLSYKISSTAASEWSENKLFKNSVFVCMYDSHSKKKLFFLYEFKERIFVLKTLKSLTWGTILMLEYFLHEIHATKGWKLSRLARQETSGCGTHYVIIFMTGKIFPFIIQIQSLIYQFQVFKI